MDTQTQIDRLIELAIIQRTELKQLVEQLPQLREHLNAEVERTFEEAEPQIRTELEEFVTRQAADKAATLGTSLEAKIGELAKSLEESAQAKYSALIATRDQNATLLAQAEERIAAAAGELPAKVKDIVAAELARFPRAGEIDQLRKEFAEPRGLNPRGKWQAGETYNKLDLVTINGDSYTSNIDGNSTRPTRSSADWTLVAARGTGGGGGPTSLSELTTVPSNGDILIGSGTSWVTSNLTAGAGISITVGAGEITISATDGDITLDDGTAASPSLHFTNDADTGLYRPADNTLGISVSGTQIAYFDTNGLTIPSAGVVAGGSFHGANGNANNPTFSFESDQDTGMYRHGTNELGFTVGGTEKAVMTSTTFTVTPNLVGSGSGTFGGNLTVSGSGTIDVTNAASRALIIGPVAQSGGNLPYASIKTLSTFADFALNLENTNATAGQGLGLRIVAGSASNDLPLFIKDRTNATTLFSVGGTGNATLAGNLTVSGGTVGTAASTNLTLSGGSSGASLVLGQGASAASATLTPTTTGGLIINGWTGESTNPQSLLVLGNGKASGVSINVVGTAFNLSTVAEAANAKSFFGFIRNQGNGRGDFVWYNDNTNDTSVFTTADEVMRLTRTGNLLIGTTTDATSGARLQAQLTGTDGTVSTLLSLRKNTNGAGTGVAIDFTPESTDTPLAKLSAVRTSQPNGYTDFRFSTWNGSALSEQVRLVGQTGNLLLGTTTDSGNGKLQLATHTTSAGGIGFGTDVSLYRSNTRELTFLGSGSSTFIFAATLLGSTVSLKLGDGTNNDQGIIESQGGSLVFKRNTTTALTLDSSQRCILAGALRLNNAYTAGAPTATGYVTLQDSAGNTYKVLVGT